jgi:hypothetical protein
MQQSNTDEEHMRKRLDSLNRALNENNKQSIDPKLIRPVILPFNLDGVSPSFQLPCQDLYVMWVISTPSDEPGYVNEVYVTHEHVAQLSQRGIDLPKIAMRNIAELSGRQIAVGGHSDGTGKLIGMALTQDDGYGPARTMFGAFYRHYFPEGYWIAIPSRNMAFTISKQANEADLTNFKTAVEDTFDSEPGVCRRLLEPAEIAVPDDWLTDAYEYLDGLPTPE